MAILIKSLPRARLYTKTPSILKALLRLMLLPMKRSKFALDFEKAAARNFGFRHALGLSTCRMAVYFALKNMGLKKGDEVLMTPLTIPDIVNAVIVLGGKPVFVDIELESQCVDLEDLKTVVNDKTKFFILTYLCGFVPHNLDQIFDYLKSQKIETIEDISQNYGARYKGRFVGTFGRAAAASLSVSKSLSSAGGGLFFTNETSLFESVVKDCNKSLGLPAKSFVFFQLIYFWILNIVTNPYIFSIFTCNVFRLLDFLKPGSANSVHDMRKGQHFSEDSDFYQNPPILRQEMPAEAFHWLSDVQAIVAMDVLNKFEQNNNRRIHLAEKLIQKIDTGINPYIRVDKSATVKNTYWHFFIYSDKRSLLQSYLLRRGIDTTGFGLKLCSELEAFKQYYRPTPVAKMVKDCAIFLPIHSEFSQRQMELTADILNQYHQQFDLSWKLHHVE